MIESILNSSLASASSVPIDELNEVVHANEVENPLDAKSKRRSSNSLRRKMESHIHHQKNIIDLSGLAKKELRALPPEHQMLREKMAILESPKLKELLGDQKILEIKKDEQGYLVLTENFSLRVKVEYLTPKMIGPRPFALHFK